MQRTTLPGEKMATAAPCEEHAYSTPLYEEIGDILRGSERLNCEKNACYAVVNETRDTPC